MDLYVCVECKQPIKFKEYIEKKDSWRGFYKCTGQTCTTMYCGREKLVKAKGRRAGRNKPANAQCWGLDNGEIKKCKNKDCQKDVVLENKVLYYKRLRDNMVTCKGCREELVYSEFQTHECKAINLNKDDINMAEEILQASNEDFLVSFLSLILYYIGQVILLRGYCQAPVLCLIR